MTTWNYRVFRKDTDSGRESFLELREVHYNDDESVIITWTASAMRPFGKDVDELRKDLEKMLEALEKPILRERVLEQQLPTKPKPV